MRVRNGFIHEHGLNGYRDVKLCVNLDGHICEIQLHLSSFFSLKDGQHTVCEWSRQLKVSNNMQPQHLFVGMRPDVRERMIELARMNWRSNSGALLSLLLEAGQYEECERIHREVSIPNPWHESGILCYRTQYLNRPYHKNVHFQERLGLDLEPSPI